MELLRPVLAVLLQLAILISISACGADPATSAAAVGGLKLTLSELQSTINKAMTNADVVTANKLEAADARIRALLPELERVEKGLATDANETVNDLTREANQIVLEVRRTISGTENSAFSQVNQSLAVTSQVLDNLPFVKIDPYIAAIEPSRIFAATTDRKLTIFGHLPGDPAEDITVRIGDTSVAAVRTKSAGIEVEIPKDLSLVETTFVPVSVEVRTPSGPFGWFRKTTAIADRVYVAKAEPYQCTARWMQSNPEFMVEVPAASVFTDEATTQSNAARATINRTITARDIFIATVPTATDLYDLATVRIKDPRASFAHYGDCDHYRTRHEITTWNPETVSYELYAPEVQHHAHKGWKMRRVLFGKTKIPYLYYVSAGGTKAVIKMAPIFIAARKGVTPLKEIAKQEFKMGWRTIDLNARTTESPDWSIHVSCEFQDGKERWSSGELVLRSTDPEEGGRGVLARVADGHLYVQPMTVGEQPASDADTEADDAESATEVR
jgi:ElaB/YqjD/DUF883 family membrane-anchored ribosome-binding protein